MFNGVKLQGYCYVFDIIPLKYLKHDTYTQHTKIVGQKPEFLSDKHHQNCRTSTLK